MAEGGRHRILVVDDSALPRDVVRGILAEDGYDIMEAQDGLGGITAALELLPDLIISDVVMPDISGYQLCRFLKHDPAASRIPIILMTATELSKRHRFWGIRSGADRFVAKDTIARELRREVATLLANLAPGSAWRWAQGQGGVPPQHRNIRTELALLFDKLLFQTTIAQEVRLLATYVHDSDKWLSALASLAWDLADCACVCVHLAGADGARLHVATKHRLSKAQIQQARQATADQFGRPDPRLDAPNAFRPAVSELLDESLPDTRFPCHCTFALQTTVSRLGSFTAFFDNPASMTTDVRQQLAILAHELAPVACLAVTYRELQRLSIIDNLTLLFDALHFQERLTEAFKDYQLRQQTFSVLLADVDHFKMLNAQHGHAVGDVVLRQLAQKLLSAAQSSDVAARSDDDELAILLPATDLRGAAELAEWYRAEVADMAFGDPAAPLRVTVSVGVTEVSAPSRDGMAVLWAARAAVCEAKQAGRNAVRIFRA